MEINILNYSHRPAPFYFSSTYQTPFSSANLFAIQRPFSPSQPLDYRPKLSRQKRPTFLASSSSSVNPNNNDPGAFSWRRTSQRFLKNLGDSVKKETGFSFEDGQASFSQLVGRLRGSLERGLSELEQLRSELLLVFVDWNKWERWKVMFVLFVI